MLDILTGSVAADTLNFTAIAICTFCSLLCGCGIAFIYTIKNKYSKGFFVTLILLPAIVQAVIMMVNGNVGTGVAVAGTFGLVRFRSVPGTARDIAMIFFAMAIGLATGMGYITFAFFFLFVIGAVCILMFKSNFGDSKAGDRVLRITIPENLDYEHLFDDLFEVYTEDFSLSRVKTTNMGSLFELSYDITLKKDSSQKEFIDELRCRNGNLNIILSRPMAATDAL